MNTVANGEEGDAANDRKSETIALLKVTIGNRFFNAVQWYYCP